LGHVAHSSLTSIGCGFVLCIILVAGLWPLHISQNRVEWLQAGRGLGFAPHGSIFSKGSFGDADASRDSLGSLELWLVPDGMDDGKTICAFYDSESGVSPFSLQQYRNGLRIQRRNIGDDGVSRTAWFVVDNVFSQGRPVFLTVTLEKSGTSVYIDGRLARVSSILGSAGDGFRGRLVLADSPSASNSWSGKILGLSIYGRQLTNAQVAEHSQLWTQGQEDRLVSDTSLVALYKFNEGRGNIVQNAVNGMTDLIIPSHYSLLQSGFLTAPWREYKATWSYWLDFLVNIVGFVPLGFCFAAWLASMQSVRHPKVGTIAIGFATSLTIEILQAFLPTRSSGMTDVITNTLGTTLGVCLYDTRLARRAVDKVRLL